MRWSGRCPRHGNTRIIKKFLLFPKTICGDTRWLEHVRYRQSFYGAPGPNPDPRQLIDPSGWWDKEWVDDEDDNEK